MSDWWSYSISDLVLFSANSYYRLIELYHLQIWPLQIGAILIAILILVLLWRKPCGYERIITGLLAACWFWIAWLFLKQSFSSINWAASWYALGFVVEAMLLIGIAVIGNRLRFTSSKSASGGTGIAIYILALAMPCFSLFDGDRKWSQAELFGITPDPTAIATLGLLLLGRGWARGILLLLPLVWVLISGATLWVLDSDIALLLPVIAVLVFSIAILDKKPVSNRD